MAHTTLRNIAHWCAFSALLLMTGRPVSAAQMSFDDRIACQTAIETVRWSKTLWPETNPEPKPLLSEVLSQDAIRTKVIDSARMHGALDGLYGVRIDDAMLQTEIERMSAATRAPDQLRELYAALDNDPVRVAECLARPTLVRQQLETHYANDRNQHSPARAWAEADLRRAAAQGSTGGEDIVFVRQTEEKTAGGDTVRLDDDLDGIRLSPNAWDARLAQLDKQLTQPQSATQLRESATEFVRESLLDVSGGRMTVRVQRWPKADFATWWRAEAARWGASPRQSTEAKRMLTLPPVTGLAAQSGWAKGGGADDTWHLDPYVPAARYEHSAIWTGSEMIVWGGRSDEQSFQSGGRYSPATDTWMSTSLVGAPSKRYEHAAVWTGSRMIVWGGSALSGEGTGLSIGAIYDPTSDTWTAMSSTGAPSSRAEFAAVWTGNKMLVWGGFRGVIYGDGARYDPVSDKWSPMTPANAPTPRWQHTGVWTGTRLLIWGGFAPGGQELSDGRSYDPETNTWLSISSTGAPAARARPVAVWTGEQMIVWGGSDSTDALNSGGSYDPDANTWMSTPLAGAPSARSYGHSAVWDGDEMIVWGGGDGYDPVNTGARYKPGATAWVALDSANAPTARYYHTAVWTGDEMIVWGGDTLEGITFASGARYRPTTDMWTAMADIGASPGERTDHTAIWTGTEMLVWGGTDGQGSLPYLSSGGKYRADIAAWETIPAIASRRHRHTAVWTGTEMLVWGGFGTGNAALDSGARYNPMTDDYQSLPIDGVQARHSHSAVWLNGQMIVWGGRNGTVSLGNGGRYNPQTDAWSLVSTNAAPAERYGHTAVTANGEMLVWGGRDGNDPLGDGARYAPAANTWTPIAESGAPSARFHHTAISTGSDMIVWGGVGDGFNTLASGARYSPSADAWMPLANTGAPAARYQHSAVWTGEEMLIWGGYSGSDLKTGGRYRPGDNSWTAMTTAGAPRARRQHSAVWTGEEMLVWGGYDGERLNHLGAYSAATTPTSPIIFADGFE